MATIGYLKAILSADTGSFVADMTKAGNSVTGLQATVESGFSSVAGLAKAAFGTFAGFAIGDKIKEGIGFAIDEASNAEQVISRLNAILKATGYSAGFSGTQLEEMAAQLAKTTTFSKGDVLDTMGSLLPFTNIRGDVFQGAIQSVLDISSAMGTDASSAATMLGKALQNPAEGLSALTRAGLSFTEQQKAQIVAMAQAGDTMGAQKAILEAVQGIFGGSAAAAADTFGGALSKLQSSFEDIAESIGNALLPILQKVVDVVAAAVAWWENLDDSTKGLIGSAAAFVGILAAMFIGAVVLIGGVAALASAFASCATAQAILLALSGPAGWAILAGAVFIAGGAVLAIAAAYDSSAEKARKAAEEADSLAKNSDKMRSGLGKQSAAADDLVKKLQTQIITYGMSQRAIERYNAVKAGASEAQIKEIDAMQRKLDMLDAEKKAVEDLAKKQEDLRKAAESVVDSVATPFEKYAEKIGELKGLRDQGAISADIYQRASLKAFSEANPQDSTQAGFRGLMEGTVEALKAESAYRNKTKTQEDLLRAIAGEAKSQTAEAQNQTALLQKVADNKPVEFKL